MSEPVVGIDLGTTNSCAAYLDGDQVKMVPSKNGGVIVPSILSLDDKGNLTIGTQAKRRFVTNPKNTIYGAKRLMGRKFGSDEMDNIKDSFFYEVAPDASGEAKIVVEGREFSLTEVSALILEEIKDQCQEYFEKKVSKVVVSVPAYFDNTQREAVRQAGIEANLDVLRIINEPTAAALAYGFGKRDNQQILVFDLGGGTFDVTVLKLYEEVYEVVATGGDSFLGGIDFDNAIVTFMLEHFLEQEGIDLSDDRVALQRIRDAAENVKIDLSATDVAQINLPFITMKDGEPITLALEITREKFQELVDPLVKKTLRITEKVLLEGKVDKDKVDEIILVGGMTRMPLVQEYVERYFGRRPRRDVHPDEVVAQGAAILADSLSKGSGGVVLRDVLPVSIGLNIRGQFKKIINKNTTLPTKVIKSFKTSKDNQNNVKLEMYQGESRETKNNAYLGHLTLDGIPPMPKGKAEVLVAFLVNDEGILSVKAKEKHSNKIIEAEFETQEVVQRESYRADQILSTDSGEEEVRSSAAEAPPSAAKKEGGGLLSRLKSMFSS